MRVGIITGPCLATTHGTGAQVLRFFGASTTPFFHLYWDRKSFGLSEHPASYLLENKDWPLRRGRRLVAKIKNRLSINWWKENRVHKQKLRWLMRFRNLQCDVAYVVVAREHEAQRANSILKVLKCPYVVHLMDLDHENGLDPDTMTHYGHLLCGAASVLVLNDGLRIEAEKFHVQNLQTVTFGQDVNPYVTKWVVGDKPIRLLIAGSIETHQEGLELLAHAWSMSLNKFRIEIIYAGANSGALPESLAKIVTNLGYVSTNEYQKILSTCQLAYLPGPSNLNTIGRFSVPSRLSDYLMNGLPVIACLAAGSAAEMMLAPLIPGAVRTAKTPEQIVGAIANFTASQMAWQKASQEARDFAVDNLALSKVRDEIFKSLHEAMQASPHEYAALSLTSAT